MFIFVFFFFVSFFFFFFFFSLLNCSVWNILPVIQHKTARFSALRQVNI